VANLSLVFDLVGRDLSASKAFKDVGDSADRAGKSGENFGSLVSKGLKLAGGALLGAGLIEGFKSLYDAAAESAKIGRLTEQVIKSTGGAAGISAKQVGDLATAISKKTGVDDEAIQSGANLLLTFTNVRNEVGKGSDIFNQATGIITDMSVALGQDTSSSALQLGKALNDPIKGVTALQRVGVSFTAAQKDQISTLVESGKTMEAQKLILAELGKEFGGAAEAASTPFDKLKVNLGNLAETLGNNLIPYVNDFSDFMSNKVLPAVTDVGGVISGTLGPALSLAVGLFKGLFDTVGTVVGWLADLPGPAKAAALAFGAMAILKGPLNDIFGRGGVLDGVAIRALMAKDAIAGLGGAGGIAKAGLSGLVNFFGGPWGVAIAGATFALPMLIEGFKKLAGITDVAEGAQKRFREALEDTTGVMDDNIRKAAEDNIRGVDGLAAAFNKAGVSAQDAIDGLLGNADAQNRVNQALQDYITTSVATEGRGNKNATAVVDARNAYQDLVPALGKARAEQEFFGNATGGTKGAIEGQTGALSAGQPVLDTFTQGLQDTADAADDAKKQTNLFKGALDALTGEHVSLIEAQSAFYDALSESAGAMKDLSGTAIDANGNLNLQSEAGRKASDVLLDIRSSGNQLIATMKEQGSTSDQVAAKEAELRDSFIKSAEQMGISRGAAENLANQILGIPDKRTTTITADTATATKTLQQIQRDIDNMHGRDIVVTVSGQGGLATYTTDQRNLLYSGKAAGGAIFGPGSGTSDTAGLFALSNGEHVWTAKEVAAAGGHSSVEGLRKMVLAAGGGRAAGGPIGINEIIDSRPLDGVVAAVKKALAAASLFTGTGGGNTANRALGQRIAAAMGLASQFGAIDYVFSHESGWNNLAQNPTSTAFGIPQFLNSTWATVGGHKTTDPALQIQYGLRYMNKYGGPNGAAEFWRQHHWYENGTNYVPSDQLAVLHKGEAVVPASQNQGAPYQAGGDVAINIYDVNGVLMGTMRGEIARAGQQAQLTAAAGSSRAIR